MKQASLGTSFKKDTNTSEREGKRHTKSWQEGHAEILKNIQSTNIGKPTQVDAQRILQIMENLYQNLTIYMYLDIDFVQKFIDLTKGRIPKDLLNQLSPVAKDLLVHQAEAEQKFKPYAAQMADTTNLVEEQDLDEDKKQQAKQSKQFYEKMENNFKNCLRYLKENPQDFDVIKHMRPNPNSDLCDLVHCIDCQKVIFQKKLSTAHEEEESHKKQLQELKKRIENLQKKKADTEKDLKQSRAERENFQKEKKEELEKLRSDIQLVRADKKKKRQDLQKEKESKIKQLEKEHDDIKKELDEKIQKLDKDFKKQKEDNLKAELALKTRKGTQASLLEENIRTYDNMMEDKMTEVTELKEELNKINKELSHLEDHFAKIEQERKRELDLKNEIQKRKDEYNIQQRRRNEAATRICLAYRLYKENSKKKKKKRGGKKK